MMASTVAGEKTRVRMARDSMGTIVSSLKCRGSILSLVRGPVVAHLLRVDNLKEECYGRVGIQGANVPRLRTPNSDLHLPQRTLGTREHTRAHESTQGYTRGLKSTGMPLA